MWLLTGKSLRALGKHSLEGCFISTPFCSLIIVTETDKRASSYIFYNLTITSILHSSDKVLSPTSMVDFLGYVQNFTDIGVRIINDLFLASGWDLKNLTGSLQEEGNRFTLIAPVDEVFTGTSYGISTEVIERFATEAWSRHLNEFLMNLLVPDPYTMYQISEELGDIRELDTLGGNTIVVDAGNFFTSDGMALDLSANCTDG